MNNARIVKVGTTAAQRKLFFKLNQVSAKHTACGIHSNEELAKELGVSSQAIQDMEQRLLQPMNIDDKELDSGIYPDELLEEKQHKQMLNNLVPQFINKLSARDHIIFQRRLLENDTLDNIGADLFLTRERIRQITNKIKDRFGLFLRRHAQIDRPGRGGNPNAVAT